MNISYTEDSGNATPPVSHCDHNKINAAAVTKLSIPSEIRYRYLHIIGDEDPRVPSNNRT